MVIRAIFMMLSRNSWSRNVNVPRLHARRSQDYTTILADDRESQRLPTWNTYCEYTTYFFFFSITVHAVT